MDTTAAQLSPDSSFRLEALQLSRCRHVDAVTSHNVLFHYSKFPLISVFVVVFDKAHISLLNSARRVFMCYGVTFSQPTKVPFRPAVPNRIFAFSEVFCSSRLFLHPERLLSAHQRLDRHC